MVRDLEKLRRWSGRGYKEWLIQSLWINFLYVRGQKIDTAEVMEWLSDFPPRMNGPRFLDYAYKLYWVLLRSGAHHEAALLIERLYGEYGHLKEVKRLYHIAAEGKRLSMWLEYWRTHLFRSAKQVLKNRILEWYGWRQVS